VFPVHLEGPAMEGVIPVQDYPRHTDRRVGPKRKLLLVVQVGGSGIRLQRQFGKQYRIRKPNLMMDAAAAVVVVVVVVVVIIIIIICICITQYVGKVKKVKLSLCSTN
jgi:hypothetical protein